MTIGGFLLFSVVSGPFLHDFNLFQQMSCIMPLMGHSQENNATTHSLCVRLCLPPNISSFPFVLPQLVGRRVKH